MTIQKKSKNRRSLSMDTTEVNTVTNTINNTGYAGFWYYADNNQDTEAQVKLIEYLDLQNIPDTFAPDSLTHTITDVSGLQDTLTNKLNKSGHTPNRTIITYDSGNIFVSQTITSFELECLNNTNTNIETNFINPSNWVAFICDNKLNKSGYTPQRVIVSDISGDIFASQTISTHYLANIAGTTMKINTNFVNTVKDYAILV